MHAILWFLAFAIIFYLLMRAGDGADMGTPALCTISAPRDAATCFCRIPTAIYGCTDAAA